MSQLLTCTSSTRPSDVRTGDLLFETDTNRLIFWDGIIWRVYNSDATLPGTGGDDELHYPAGIWSDSGATYYVDTAPFLHFDYKYIDGQTASDGAAEDGKVLQDKDATSSGIAFWGSRSSTHRFYSTSSVANNQLAYNDARKGFHWRKYFTGASSSQAVASLASSGTTLASETVNARVFTYFIVLGITSDENAGNYINTSSSDTQNLLTHVGGSKLMAGKSVFGMGSPSSLTPPDNGDPVIAVVRSNGDGTASGWVRGAKEGDIGAGGGRQMAVSGISGAATATFGHSMGFTSSSVYWKGVVSEILLYKSTLSSAQINTITSYLCNKYNYSHIALNV